jgi:tripartite-type tricarboxylate transporter receptor subunit TctC
MNVLATAAPALIAAVGCLCLAAPPSYAADSPARPVRMVVPYPPGGPTDVFARLIATRLAEELKQQIVIDNRTGASGIIGCELVARAAPDGHTLLVNPSIHVIVPHLVSKIPYHPVRDFTHVTLLATVPLFLVVHPALPVKSVKELIAYAKFHPGKLSFASSSNGTPSHLAGEQFKLLAAVAMQHVPYKGSAPALIDLASGQVQLMFDSTPSALPFVKSGRLRALAVTTAKRTQAAPDIPTMAESGLASFDLGNWYGIWGPRGMPPQSVARLNRAIDSVMSRKDVNERLLDLGADRVVGVSGEAFERFVSSELARFESIVKTAGVKME